MGSQRARARRRAGEQQAAELEEMRRTIWRRHCRLGPHGEPLKCEPSLEEKADPDGHWRRQGLDEKLILINEQHGYECARELEVLDGKPRRVYQCPRSKSGHHHTAVQHQ